MVRRDLAVIVVILMGFLAVPLKMVSLFSHAGACSKASAGLSLITDLMVGSMAAGLDAGSAASIQLVKIFLAKIEEVDDSFLSIIEPNADALKIVADHDEERLKTGLRRAYVCSIALDVTLTIIYTIYGVVNLLRDNIVLSDKINATSESFAHVGPNPGQESSVTKRLRAAEAILLGKFKLTEALARARKPDNL